LQFLILSFFLYHLFICTKFKNHTLSVITIDMNSIQIDDQIFIRPDIEYIEATAPEYANSTFMPLRKILIAGRFGKARYWFGGDNILSKKYVVYAEYPALYRETVSCLLRDGRLIVNDL
jgi:hypothetical protein